MQLRQGAEAHLDSARHELSRRLELVDDAESAAAELDKLLAERERALPALDDAAQRVAQAEAALVATDQQLAAAHLRVDAARSWLQHLRDHAELEQWRGRHARILATEERLAVARAELHRNHLDAEALSVIETAALAVEVAAARLEVAGARVRAQVHAPVDLQVDGTSEAVRVGDERTWVVAEPFTVRVDDRVTFTVEPGHGARELVVALDDARADLVARCGRWGVSSVDEAKERHAAREAAMRDEADEHDALARDIGDLTPALVAGHVAQLEERLAAAPNDGAVDEDLASSIAEAEASLDSAERDVASLLVARDDQLADERMARRCLDTVRIDDRVLDARIGQVRANSERLAERLCTARAAAADDQLRAAVDAELDAVRAAAAEVDRSTLEVAELDPVGAQSRLANAVAAVERVQLSIRDDHDERTRLVAVLEAHGEMGLAAELDEARTTLEHLQREHIRTEARAQAALLLHDTFEARRDEARQRYSEPFRVQIERLARIVFGPDVQIELDEQLRVARRIVGGVALRVEQLSVGAREQLGLLSRLACAAIVSTDGGAPVIFDDVLGYTDPERLRTMGAAIGAASGGCQVIVLTCTPSRYAHVGNATTVSLG